MTTRPDSLTLVERMLAGDRLALARLITQVENRTDAVPAIMRAVYARAHAAYVLGVTGPPGAGKSTVVDRLTARYRAAGETVGIVAVDPSSPFTGGAVLGDRIRMQAHALDPGVFIRSMATRGAFGGLARATGDVIKLLAAYGFQWILIETVGVGQTELDIMKLADTTVVVLVPESGDAVQAMKAGLLEAAEVFVVNKADRSGAPALMAELTFSAHLQSTSPIARRDLDWEIPVLSTEAQNDVGIAELLETIRRHRRVLEAAGALQARRRERRRQEFRSLLVDRITAAAEQRLADGDLRNSEMKWRESTSIVLSKFTLLHSTTACLSLDFRMKATPTWGEHANATRTGQMQKFSLQMTENYYSMGWKSCRVLKLKNKKSFERLKLAC